MRAEAGSTYFPLRIHRNPLAAPKLHTGCSHSPKSFERKQTRSMVVTAWLLLQTVCAPQCAGTRLTEAGTPGTAQATPCGSSGRLPLPEGRSDVPGAGKGQKWQSGGLLYRYTPPQLRIAEQRLTVVQAPGRALQSIGASLSGRNTCDLHSRRPLSGHTHGGTSGTRRDVCRSRSNPWHCCRCPVSCEEMGLPGSYRMSAASTMSHRSAQSSLQGICLVLTADPCRAPVSL